jgi:RHS repeat-associated protein
MIRRFRSRVTPAVVAIALLSLITQALPAVATADPLLGADGQTIPRESLLTPQELGKASVDGLQYGNPTEGLTLVAPPAPTNDGGAHLTYPLNVPQGRGITPGLQLSYDSGGGDSWAGVGWDLSVGDVSVDTRWGAPRFSPTVESESYTLNGDPLVPNGLDGSLPRVNADRQDFTRQVETQYEEITRHYVTPDAAPKPQQPSANYYWQVRDKVGNIKWYGGYPDAGGPNGSPRTAGPNGIDRSAIVTDGKGNQVHWLLAARRDVGVNMIKYHYTTLNYTNDGSGWLQTPSCVSDASTLCAKHTYLSGIEYTDAAEASRQPEDAPYHVQFLLESQVHPQNPVRTDPMITAIGGYLDLTADRLAQVNVYYQPTVANGRSYDASSPDTFGEQDPAHPTAQLAVRYDLAYKTGAFGKSQLASVTQVGNDGTTKATHTFDYFNDVGATTDPTTHKVTGYQGLGPEKAWNPGSDNLNTNAINANTGVLGSAETNAGEGHFYLGFNAEEPEKEGSFGVAVKLGGGDTNNRSEWIDLNGDGLPDKVWADSHGIQYRKNLGGAGATDTPTFSDPITVSGLNQLSAEHNFNFNVGLEAFFGVTAAFGVGATYNWADQYFIDVNGDGLPDLVSHGSVLFDHIDLNGVPTFTTQSFATPVPIDQGSAAPGDASATAGIKADIAKQSPLVDTVRRWVAAYTGTVSILAPVTLTPPAGTTSKDGVRVAIQHNEAELVDANLTASGDTAFTAAITRPVTAGDRLYFRVGSIYDGANDQVQWSPTITYTAIAGVSDLTKLPLDENGLDRTVYSSSADFTTSGRPGSWANMPYDGTVTFIATVHKSAVTSDDLHLVLKHNDVVVPGSVQTIPASFTGDYLITVPSFAVTGPISTTDPTTHKTTTTSDHVSVYLAVDSQIDLTKVSWRPQLQYETASTTDASGHVISVPTRDSSGTPNMVMDLLPEIEQYPYHPSSAVQEQWTATTDGTYNAVVTVTHGANTPHGTAILSVKNSAGLLVGQAPIDLPATGPIVGSTTVTAVVSLGAAIKANTKYWFDVTIRDPQISAAGPLNSTVALRPAGATDSNSDITVPALLSWEGRSNNFPIPYRGWGVAGYNGDGGLATSAIDETAFVIDPNTVPKPGDGTAPSGYEDPTFKQPASDRAYPYVPVVKATRLSDNPAPNSPIPLSTPAWQGTRANLAASGDVVRSSRLGSDSIEVGTAGGQGHAVDRTAISGPQFAATVGIGPASLAFSIAPNFGLQDYQDMNGDGLPDVITPNQIQYTMPRGQYETSPRHVDALGHTSQDLNLEVDPGISAGLLSIGPGKSNAHSASTHGGHDSSSAPGAGVGTFAIGASVAWTNPTSSGSSAGDPTQTYSSQISQAQTSKKGGGNGSNLPLTSQSFADVNGDGLPDMVAAHPDGIYVRYNLGYGFTQAEFKIGDGGFSSNETYGGSLGGGFMMPDESFSGGVSANWNYDISKYTWRDVNGDGIPDRIFKGNTQSQPTVAIGTGTGLLPDVPFGTFESTSALPGGTAYAGPQSSFSSTNGIGASLDFTIGIPCFLFCNIIIGVGGSYQNSNSSPQVDLQDVNGDGYPDSVKSTSDGTLLVRANQTGKSNLLAKVTNPIGGTIALDYTRAGNTTAQPNSVWTMSKVDVNDGHPGDGVDNQLTSFSYDGGRYDRLHRQQLGFATVVQKELDPTHCSSDTPPVCATVRTTTTTYLNNNVFDAGLVASSLLTQPAEPPASGVTRLKDLVNTYQYVDIRNGGPADLTPPLNDPANVRTLAMSVSPLLTRTEALNYTAADAIGAHSRMDFQYDRLGNLTTQTDEGQLDNPDDNAVATYTYSTCQQSSSAGLTQVFGCGQGNVINPPAHPSPLYSPDECPTYVSLPVTFIVTNGKTGADKVTYRDRDGSPAICDNASVTQLDEYASDGVKSTTQLAYDQWGSYNRIVYPVGENGKRYAVEYTYDLNVGHANVAAVHEYQFSPPANGNDDVASFLAEDYTQLPLPDNPTLFASSVGLSSTATFDPLSGRVATTTDPNNLVTRYTYDALNRISSVSSPRDPADPPLVTYSYDLSSPGNAKAIAHNYDFFHPLDTIDTIAFVDGNGRVTQNKRDARVFVAANQSPVIGAVVSGHVDYDALGRAVKEYNPTIGAGSFAAFDATAPSGPVTTTSYDALDRTLQTVEPGNRVTTTKYDFAQVNGSGPMLFRTTAVDPAQHTNATYSDIRNVEIAAVDTPATTDPSLTTLFRSDGMGQLTQVTDSAGNLTTNTYDWMGRRTSTQTPDGGLVNFGYDAEGKLATQLTPDERALGQPPTTYSYDFGRLVKVDYPGTTPDVTYTYGGQRAPNNGAGRVVREEDGSRIQTLEYNPAGQITKQTAEMKLHNWPGPGATAFQWTTQWSYDGFGRLASMVYPDGESLKYGYDAGGAVSSVAGDKTWFTTVVTTNPDGTTTTTQQPTTNHYAYLNDRQYDVFGHRRFDQLGNAVTSESTFDPNTQWLTRVLTISPNRAQADAAHKTIQDLNYTYDAAGNPVTYNNNLPAPVANLFGGATSEKYSYDGYNRLVGASGIWQAATGKSQHYTFSLKFDTQGNVVNKTQYDAVTINGKDNPVSSTTYSFNRTYPATGAPHQAVSDSTGTYRYDADGNLLGIVDAKGKFIRQLTWDATDQMRVISDSSGATTYAYDDNGERRIERGPSGETTFINPWVTVLNGNVMYKHVWAGNDRVATQKALPTGEETRYFLHKDLQGSTNMVTDSLGNTFQHNEYFPTGETWISENSTVFRTPYQYAGGYTDDVRKTVNVGNRWYDPTREMFYSPDPALTDSSAVVNQPSIRAAYAYAGSNAIANTDPTGKLWATVNKTYAAEQSQSREQILRLVAQAPDGAAARALFKDVYGRSYQSIGWSSKLSSINEKLSAPLFEFRFTKAENGSVGVTLSIFGSQPRGLNQTAKLQIAADNLAAMAPANAHQAQSQEPLTPEAAKFAQALHQSAPAGAGAAPAHTGQGLAASLGFSPADIQAAAHNLAAMAATGHGAGESFGFNAAELRIASQNLAAMG